jgi:hypothetical protein
MIFSYSLIAMRIFLVGHHFSKRLRFTCSLIKNEIYDCL